MKSAYVLFSISDYFRSINIKASVTISESRQDARTLVIKGDIKSFIELLLPWVIAQNWLTRKSLDIYWWCIALHIRHQGLHLSPSGKQVLSKMKMHMNQHRYTTSPYFSKLNFAELENDVMLLFIQGADKTPGPRTRGLWVFDKLTQTQHQFSSMLAASKFCNVSLQTISNYKDSKRFIQNRYLIHSS